MKHQTLALIALLLAPLTAEAAQLQGGVAKVDITDRTGPGQVTWRSIGPAHFGAMHAPTFSPHEDNLARFGAYWSDR